MELDKDEKTISRFRPVSRLFILVAIIMTISATHYLTDAGLLGLKRHSLHSIEYLVNFLPILLGAFWYGLKGGISTAIFVGIFYIPSVIGPLGTGGILSLTERILEFAVYGAVGIITGFLSEREKRQTIRLVEAAEQLQKDKRLSVIGQMVSTVAHDVITPLQNIQLYIDVLRMEGEMDESRMDTLKGIDRSVAMLDTLARQLLEYAKPADLCFSSVAVGSLVDQALDVMKSRFGGIKVYLYIEQPEREIRVDSAKFARVLINVIANAIEAMPSGGELKIHSYFSENEPAELRLSVADTGIGICEEYLERVHEAFFTTKPQGTGLGIPICKKIVEAHGGHLTITTKVNEGTMVEVRIPCPRRPAGT